MMATVALSLKFIAMIRAVRLLSRSKRKLNSKADLNIELSIGP